MDELTSLEETASEEETKEEASESEREEAAEEDRAEEALGEQPKRRADRAKNAKTFLFSIFLPPWVYS
jgi:hypothetical protein